MNPSNPSGLAIKAVMGHQLEPMSQVLPSFKLTLREPLESVIHIGCYPPLLPLGHPLDSKGSFIAFEGRLVVLLATEESVFYTEVNLIGLQVF